MKLFVYVLFVVRPVLALKHSFHYDHGKGIIGPIGEPFGFNDGGQYQLNVSNFELNIRAVEIPEDNIEYRYNAGFFLQRFDNDANFHKYMEILKSNATTTICSFQYFLNDDDDDELPFKDDDHFEQHVEFGSSTNGVLLLMDSKKKWYTGNPSIHYQFKTDEGGLYYLIYQVCPYNEKVLSSFDLELHFKNIDSLGNVSYLSAGEVKLPLIFLFFSISYLLCFAIWFMNIIQILRGRDGIFLETTTNTNGGLSTSKPPVIYTIHYLMAILLLLKFCSILFESFRYYKIQATGHAEVLTFMFYIFNFIKGMFLFTVILLIGTGWSFVKHSLNANEKNVMMFVLLLQGINNIAMAMLSQENVGEKYYGLWSAVMHMVDVICCCIIIVPIVWQVNALEDRIEKTTELNDYGSIDGSITSSVERRDLLKRLRMFRTFYILVIGYVYSTRILIYLFVSILTYQYTWVKDFVIEAATLTFYVVVGMMFRPKSDFINDSSSSELNIDNDEIELLNQTK